MILPDIGAIVDAAIDRKFEELDFPFVAKVVSASESLATVAANGKPQLIDLPVANAYALTRALQAGDLVLVLPYQKSEEPRKFNDCIVLPLNTEEQTLVDFVALASKVDKALNDIKTIYNLHVHDGPPPTSQIVEVFDVGSVELKAK